MKSAFRRIERDDEQRHRKWKALGWGLFVSACGMCVALGPFVPSRPLFVLSAVALTSVLAGAVVGWRVGDRKGSMGGMVSLLFAFPLGGLFVGFPQSAGLMWIIFLFVSVPFAAMGGAFGSRMASSGRVGIATLLITAGAVVTLLAAASRWRVSRRVQDFNRGARADIEQRLSEQFIAGADQWEWQVSWKKGVWQGDYFLMRSPNGKWHAETICTDSQPVRIVTFTASRAGSGPLSPPDSEAGARARLLSLGLREHLLTRPRLIDSKWEFGDPSRRESPPALRTILWVRKGDAVIIFDSRNRARDRRKPAGVMAQAMS